MSEQYIYIHNNRVVWEQVHHFLQQLSCTYLGMGRHREGWRHGNYVIKVPRNNAGLHNNWRERDIWMEWHTRSEKTTTPWAYASCRLWHNTILVMEYAHFVGPLSLGTSDPELRITCPGTIPFNRLPRWAHHVDGGQVGYNKKGQIVAYDYAD